jgi:gamma-glutamyltranspeptidase/glutathione hydrolase
LIARKASEKLRSAFVGGGTVTQSWGAVGRAVVLSTLLTACFSPSSRAQPPDPEAASGITVSPAAFARRDMVAAAHPLAAEAGREMLRRGGNAIDAVIATQFVLNLVEPQSSGLGGGAFLVFWSAKEHRVTTFDGRETAPAAARPDRFLDASGKPLSFYDAVVGGRSVGVPGVLRMLALAHRRYGKLPWATLFEPAIKLAEEGAPISARLHTLIAKDKYLAKFEPARSYFYEPDGTPKRTGTLLVNHALADTLRLIAANGPDAFYDGPVAADIVAAVQGVPAHPGDLTLGDLAAYEAIERAPFCGTWRAWRLCGMGPPSAGETTVLEQLNLIERLDPGSHYATIEDWHLFTEASRFAFADRDRWIADPAFASVPARGLLAPSYVAARARLIDRNSAHKGPAAPGDPPGRDKRRLGNDASPEFPSTSNIAIVDSDGNALDMTTTIENAFGSRLMVRGFLLNNELTDFSFVPEQDGRPVANRVEPGKRPRSSMAPTIVFDRHGKLRMVVGSAGGSPIITDVSKTLLTVLGWDDDLAAALALPNLGNRNGATDVETGPDADDLAAALARYGHDVHRSDRPSGLTGIVVTRHGLEGAADPRRDGTAVGD